MQARSHVFIRLNIPASRLSAKPLVASYDGALLRLFKSLGLHDYEHRILEARAPKYRIAAEAELPRLHSLLAVFIPESGGGDGN
jgi:hypothetical protein